MADVNHNEILDTMLKGRSIDDLSDTEIQQIMTALESGKAPEAEKKEDPKPVEKPKVVEMPRQEVKAETPAQAAAPSRPDWDYDKFAKNWLDGKDPVAALDYASTARTGVPIFQTVPALLAATVAMAKELQELKTRTFAGQDPAQAQTIEKYIADYGLSRDARGYEAARKLAKADGLIDAPGPVVEPSKPAPPPRLPRGQSDGGHETVEQRLAANPDALDDRALEALAMRLGIVSQSHLS